jgi:hypothetical protein
MDVLLDFRTEVAPNADPDQHSPTLREYHRRLWSKDLPNGKPFPLSTEQKHHYLHHQSDLGQFSLASDVIGRSFAHVKQMSNVLCKVPEEFQENALKTIYTIGGFTVFPGNRINGKMTINGARGFNQRIFDRFDLTLKCIKLFYEGKENPLADAFERYRDFFMLFLDFRGYVDFFLLQDLINKDGEVNFFLPFDATFPTRPYPRTEDEYYRYTENELTFIAARRERMLALGL